MQEKKAGKRCISGIEAQIQQNILAKINGKWGI